MTIGARADATKGRIPRLRSEFNADAGAEAIYVRLHRLHVDKFPFAAQEDVRHDANIYSQAGSVSKKELAVLSFAICRGWEVIRRQGRDGRILVVRIVRPRIRDSRGPLHVGTHDGRSQERIRHELSRGPARAPAQGRDI